MTDAPRIRGVTATLARVGLGGVFLWAGIPKALDLDGSVAAVAAYRLLPGWAERAAGLALPWVEIAIGLLLVLGLATRGAGLAASGLLVLFAAGMASAWARGLPIECGCFGEAGPGDGIGWTEMLREAAFLALALIAVAWSRHGWGVDRWQRA